MAGTPRDALVEVARVGEVAAGRSKKFLLVCQGREVEAFLVNYRGALHAFVNRCCHVPMTMDWVENRFFTEDARYIQCATHGACYEPDTGECVAGPPLGRFLTRVPLVIREGTVFAVCPDAD